MPTQAPQKISVKSLRSVSFAERMYPLLNDMIWVEQNLTLYKYDVTAVPRNGTTILNTMLGGNNKWVGVAGQNNFYGGGGAPVGGNGAVQFNNGGVFGGDNTRLLWTTSPDRLSISKYDGGGIMPSTIVDSNCIISLLSNGNATNFWFAIPAGGATNATFGFVLGGGNNFKHAMTYMVGADKLCLTSYGAQGAPSDGLYVDAANNVSVGDIATIPTKFYVGGTARITGDMQTNSGTKHSVRTITTATLLDESYYIVLCNSPMLGLALTLPVVANHRGRIYIIKNINAALVTISGAAAETIDGASYQLLNQWMSITLCCDGFAWYVI